MAAITSNAVTGNWNDTASWSGGVIPGDGDTVTLANDAVITIPSGVTVTVGDNLNVAYATAIPAIQVNSTTGTGRLIINGKLILKGHVKQGNATWVCGPGAIVNGGGTNGQNWSWAISLAASQANAVLQINGTQAQPVTFGTEVGADRMGILGIPGSGFSDGGRVQATWCNFSNWAPSGTTTAAWQGNAASSAFDVYFRDCTWDNCGIIQITAMTANDCKVEFSRCKVTNPTSSNRRSIFLGSNSWNSTGLTGAGVRLIDGCEIYGGVVFVLTNNPNDFTFTNNVFRNISATTTESVVSMQTRCALWQNNVIFSNQNGNGGATVASPPCGLIEDTLFLRKSDGSMSDVDICRVNTGYKADITIDGAVIEFFNCGGSAGSPDNGGDFYIIAAQDAALTAIHTIRNSIFVPNEWGGTNGSSWLLGHVDTADWSRTRLVMEHCTAIAKVGTEGLLKLGEGSVDITAPAALGKFRSNLIWANAQKAYKVTGKSISGGTGRIPDGAYDSCDYNAYYNNTPGNDVYDNILTVEYANPSPPGTNDIAIGDPQFVDATRDFLSWGQSIDPTITTWEEIVDEIGKTVRQESGYNASFTVANALTWIRAGFAPRNTALRSAAHDGGDIGAVAVVSSGPPAYPSGHGNFNSVG